MLLPDWRTHLRARNVAPSTIASATPYNIQSDPRTLTTTYTIDYVRQSGGTSTEQRTMQLQRQGDRFLIAGES